MNLINCDQKCKYQYDGYCKLNQNTAISSVKVNGCHYFVQLDKDKIGKLSQIKLEGTFI